MSNRWSTLDGPVQALLDAHGHAGPPDALISALVDRLHHQMLDRAPRVDDLPIDLDMAASYSGAEVERASGGPAGSVRYQDNRYRIRVNADDIERRVRFSIAHEIIHIPFLTASGATSRTDDHIASTEWSGQEEHLCDHGAAELLMPLAAVGTLVSPQPTIDDVVAVAERCEASIEASLRRVAKLSQLKGCAVVLEPKLKPTEIHAKQHAAANPPLLPELAPPQPQPRLRVTYAVDCGLWIPKDKSVDDNCPLATITEHDETVDYVGQTGLLPQPLAVSAQLMPYRRNGQLIQRVVALVFDAHSWGSAA